MKNSKEYAGRLEKLFRSWKQKNASVRPRTFDDPIDAVVYASISEHVRGVAARAMLKRIQEHFADYNDLRVSRREEILDVLEADDEGARKAAQALPHALNAVFHRTDRMSLAELREMGKRPARKELDEMELSRFVVNYCFLTALEGHAIPLTQAMIETLRENECIHPEADEADITGFLERQIAASEAYTFYALLRRESEAGRRTAATTRKTARRKTAAKKTTKKKVSKKKK